MSTYQIELDGTIPVPNFPTGRDELLTRKGERFCRRLGLVPLGGFRPSGPPAVITSGGTLRS